MANESTSNPTALAIEHHSAGRFDLAEAAYLQALAQNPSEGDALHGLGILAWQTGHIENALMYLREASAKHPDIWRYTCTTGRLLVSLGKHADAVAAFEHAVRLHQDSADLWFDLGCAHHALGQLAAAIAPYRQTIALQPDKIDALNNLGLALLATGHVAEAQDVLRQGVQADTNSAELWFNYGNALAATSASEETLDAYRRTLALDSAHAKAWVNLGNTLRLRGTLHEALACYQHAIECQANFADAYNNAGVVLNTMGCIDDAIASIDAAIKLDPTSSVAYNNLGNVLKNTARMQDTIACYRHAVALDPSNLEAHSNLVYAMSFDPASDDAAILSEAKRFDALHCTQYKIRQSMFDSKNLAPNKRLRIGYVSPDFRNHCQSLFTLPLLSHHDRSQYEIYCYAHLPQADDITERIQQHADVWRSTYGISDDHLAALIRADDIDILIDLTMHMSNGRPQLFARKPAPIQVAWLAYPGTTGMTAMDYRLTDPWLDPADTDAHYSEASLRLPDTFWCYDPFANSDHSLVDALQPSALPATTAGHITFGCLNNFCKVSDETLHSWGAVMAKVPASRLILLAHEGNHRQHVLHLLGQHGIDATRVEFMPYQPRHQYLQTYHRIDLCLDTLPYNGHTTSLDAYWMGVPVVTQIGNTIAGRAGWSQLNNLGLSELAALDATGFVNIAVTLASDLERLKHLRSTLRSKLEQSPLMNAKRFTRAMETAFRQMWSHYCKGQNVPLQ
ncbi:MAG TPA: tetratricopeptide repeat protein [Rhodocyclaceae bacterium]|nr:tetratricopeptide repeat protein [Rhodocyclaceae bacterium]